MRLTAEMEGGVPGPDEREECPPCKAVIEVSTARCPWCDNDIEWDRLDR